MHLQRPAPATHIPAWCRSPPADRRTPTVVHSSQFKAETVVDKHVLVISLGESGSDISLQASLRARSVKISVREGSGSGYVLPRYTDGEVGDLNTSRGFGGQAVWGPSEFRHRGGVAVRIIVRPPRAGALLRRDRRAVPAGPDGGAVERQVP